eukprot:1422939-Prorocentrum_lima.AAC.1
MGYARIRPWQVMCSMHGQKPRVLAHNTSPSCDMFYCYWDLFALAPRVVCPLRFCEPQRPCVCNLT